MSQYKAGRAVSDKRQEITVHKSGTRFTINGHTVRLSGNIARTLHALCLLAGVGEKNSARYMCLVEKVWHRDQNSSYYTLKNNLHANIKALRDNGLREAIRTSHGNGIYWSPNVALSIVGTTGLINSIKIVNEGVQKSYPTSLEKSERAFKKELDKRLKKAFKNVSQTLDSKLNFSRGGNSSTAKELIDMGFTKADVSRMFGVSRAAVGKWVEE